MARKRYLDSRAVERQSVRERAAGLDPDDDAAQWLRDNDPPPNPQPKSTSKSKTLHRWRRRNAGG